MVFGHNTNLTLGNVTLHVQTEDRGTSHGLIDTTVYFHGRVLHRRTNNYYDLLPLDDDRQQALKLRLDDQHRTVIDEIRSGALQLGLPPKSEPVHAAAPQQSPVQPVLPEASTTSRTLLLELTNAKSWLSGRRAKLEISVREQSGAPVPGAEISVLVEGSESGNLLRAQSGPSGEAHVEFEMPRITGQHAALVIDAHDANGAGHLRFALRSKPRVA
jgi:hypothetical protein